MYIVFGYNTKTEKDFGPLLLRYCDICKNTHYWHLLSERTWFTLFWLPVIPYETEWIILCSGCCMNSKTLRPEDIDKAKTFRKQTQLFLNQEITSDDYQSQIQYIEAALANSLSPEQAVRLNSEDAIRNCIHCGSEYRLSDYRSDIEHIICANCMVELPRAENSTEQSDSDKFHKILR